MIAAILAGGLGTRLRSVVSDVPKPIAPINGKPFLLYLMEYWRGQGISAFLLSVGYKSEQIVDLVGDSFQGAPVEYVIEEEPLGTGGAVAELVARSKSTMILLNGDTFFPVPLDDLLHFHISSGSDFTFSLFTSAETNRYMGVNVDDSGKLSIGEEPGSEPEDFSVNGGVYCIEPKILQRVTKFMQPPFALESELLPMLEADGGRLYGKMYDKPFIDIGVPDDYLRAYEILKDKVNG